MGREIGMGSASFSNVGANEGKASSRFSNEKIEMQPGRDAERGLLFDCSLPLDDGRARRDAQMGDAHSKKLPRKADQLDGTGRIYFAEANTVPLFYPA